MSYHSRLPQIAAELAAKTDAATRAIAEHIEARAKDRVPVMTGRLRDAIHTERKGLGEYEVIAGNTETFYGHIVEHGGAHTSPRPFMVPATEETRPEIDSIGHAALRGLG